MQCLSLTGTADIDQRKDNKIMPSGKRPHFHTNRVNEDIARELVYIIKNVKDPRVSKNFVTVTKTDTTADLKFCKIYYSHMTGEPKEVKTGLYSAIGYIRHELSERLNLRITPELTFVKDDGAEHGARINELLRQIEEKDLSRTEVSQNGEDEE
jgi:ribosome-binding factor A